jgi:hypothetical protein
MRNSDKRPLSPSGNVNSGSGTVNSFIAMNDCSAAIADEALWFIN